MGLGSVLGFAQSVEKKPVPNGLTLEIIRFKERPPYYIAVADAAAKPRGSWTPLFQKIPNWQPSADALPVKAVNIVSRIEGDAVKVNISVFTGHKFHEKEEFVADYLIRENERIVVKELSKFGIVPFEIAVVRVLPSVSVLPSVVNQTTSLQVASIEPNYSTLPSYKIKLLNNSSKSVNAFAFETTADGQKRLSGMPRGFRGESLIEPGETYEEFVSNAFQPEKKSNGEIPATLPNQTFIISTVIFADGTYEGELQNAAQFLAFRLGDKLQLKRMIPLLQAAAVNDFKTDKLSQQIANLSVEVDEPAFNEFLKNLPTFTDREKANLRISVEVSSNLAKKTLLAELKTLEANQNNLKVNTTQEQLKVVIGKYLKWLARLSNP